MFTQSEVDHDLWWFTVKSVESIFSVCGEKFFEMEKKCIKHRLLVKFILGKTPRVNPERFCFVISTHMSLYPAYPFYPLILYNQCWIAKIVFKQRLVITSGGSPLNR